MSNKFNLEEFKAGRKAITRDGCTATFIGYHEDATEFPLAAFVDGEISLSLYTKDGAFYSESEPVRDDSVAMQPEAICRYRVALMRGMSNSYFTVTQDESGDYSPGMQGAFVRWLTGWIDVIE